MVKQIIVYLPALLAWAFVGVAVLTIGMDHIRKHAMGDPEFMRMVIDGQLRKLDMLLAQALVVLLWPIPVAYAIQQNIMAQRQPHARYSMR